MFYLLRHADLTPISVFLTLSVLCCVCVCVCVCSQSELRDRRISEGLSLEQLDTELAQWEEELGEIGEEGEVGGVDDEGLLDSKTDDDLMLEIAEFL